MSGDTKLVGGAALKAQKYLRLITDVLDRYCVGYWLESGTLLGVVREGRLLPWDSDLDISIRSSDICKLKRALPELWLRGLRIRCERFVCDSGAANKGDIRIVKLRNRKRIVSRGEILLDIFIKYPDDEFYYWAVGKRVNIFKKVPRKFYDSLETVSFDGKSYPVPSEVDSYLTARYGDWKTPVKEWDYLKDDRATA